MKKPRNEFKKHRVVSLKDLLAARKTLLAKEFNFDYNVSFSPEQIRSGALFYNYKNTAMDISEREGVSAFCKDKSDDIFHTYPSYARGIDLLNTTYNFLDLTAKGRDENPEHPQDWVRYHDEYKGSPDRCC